MNPWEDNIIEVVKRRQRDVKYGVLPKTVQIGLPFGVAEQTVRRYMAGMWQRGRLFRIGGTGARRGYRCLRAGEQVIEGGLVDLLRANPWGLTTDRIADALDVRLEVAEDYIPNMMARGVVLEYRGAWRLPTALQSLAFATVGSFGYRAVA